MKRLFSLLAVLAMMLPSCGKINDAIDELGNRIDKLEQDAIPTIDEQIAAINATLSQLDAADEQLKGYIDNLTSTAAGLQDQINTTNAKIEEVKSGLQGEISTAKSEVLAQLNAAKSEIENTLTQINATIATLQAKDAELDKKIAELQTYVDTELAKTTDWVNATFTTLEQYNSLVAEVATIKTHIESVNKSVAELEARLTAKISEDISSAVATLNADIQQKVKDITDGYTAAVATAKEEITAAYTAAIQTAISCLESSLKSWVGEQLANYYTIAQIDARIAALQKTIAKDDKALQDELNRMQSSLEAMKSDLTKAYQKAIEDAVETNNGVIEGKIATEIATLNNRIDNEVATINVKISELTAQVERNSADIANLMSRIQSVSYIPAYSDGKAAVKCNDNTYQIVLDFKVSPKQCVGELQKVWKDAVSGEAIYTQTRAASLIELPAISFEADQTSGVISVIVSGDKLSDEFLTGAQEASVALVISDGNNSITSNYIPLVAPKNELHSIAFLKEFNPDSVIADIIIEVNNNNIELCTPYITNFTNLVATFANDSKSVSINGVKQISSVTANDFTKSITYQVETGSKVNEYSISISNTGLPTVVINTPNEATIPPKTEDWLPGAKMIIYNADGSIDFDGETNIRGRGNTTWSYPKKPYALKLNSKSKILGMPKHKRWVLLANWMDRTMMRNHIAFKTSMATGLDWTPRGEFVEVILNGKHIGNYYLCEQIKIDSNRVNINEMESTDIEGDAITGGYLMELDTYFDEVNKFKSAIKQLPYMFKEPDEDVLNTQQLTFMSSYIDKMESVLYDDVDFSSRKYTEYLDVDSFIDWWLTYELTGNWEPNHPKSCYMHKDKLGKLKAGPVWDFDFYTFVGGDSFMISSALYYDRLFQDPQFKSRAKERWNLFKNNFMTIPSYIASEAARLAASAELNIALWPLDGESTNQDEHLSFKDATEKMKNWYLHRIEWMDSQISTW